MQARFEEPAVVVKHDFGRAFSSRYFFVSASSIRPTAWIISTAAVSLWNPPRWCALHGGGRRENRNSAYATTAIRISAKGIR